MSEELARLIRELMEEMRELRRDLNLRHKPLLNIRETARYMGMAEKTLRNRLARNAKKPFSVKPIRIGGRIVFKREDLDAHIASK